MGGAWRGEGGGEWRESEVARRDLDAELAQCEQPVLCCGALELLIRIHWHMRMPCTCTYSSEVGKRQLNREFRVCVRVVLDVSCVPFPPLFPSLLTPSPHSSPHTTNHPTTHHTTPPNHPTTQHTTPHHTTPHAMARAHEFHQAVPQDETMIGAASRSVFFGGIRRCWSLHAKRAACCLCFEQLRFFFSHSHDLFLLTVIEAGRSPDACDSGKQDSKIQGDNQVPSVQPIPIGVAHVPAGRLAVCHWSCAFFWRLSKILRSQLAHFGKWTHRDPG